MLGANVPYNPIETAIDSVDAFNNLSYDKSKTLFQDCLGAEFPFDVIEAVDAYANKLKNLLNSDLDSLLCGNAGIDAWDASKRLLNDNLKGKFNSLTGTGAMEFSLFGENGIIGSMLPEGALRASITDVSEAGVTRLSHTVTDYDWLTNFNYNYAIATTKRESIIQSGSKKIRIYVYEFLGGYIGAKKVTVTIKVTSRGSPVSGDNITFDCETTVAVDGLYRCKEEYLGDFDALKPLEGTSHFTTKWSYNKQHATIPSAIQLSAEEVALDSNSKIKIKIVPIFEGFNDIVEGEPVPPRATICLSNLSFNNEWSKDSTGLTTQQQANIAAKIEEAQSQKDIALNSLRSDFMSSSLVNDFIDDQVNVLLKSNPAFASVDSSAITYAIKESIADNAISLAHGNSLTLDGLLIKTIANEITASSVNYSLAKLGIDKTVSAGCTKELLEKLLSSLPSAGINNPLGSLSDPFADMEDYISLESATTFAKNLVNKLSSMFDKLMSADCIMAINDSFNLCSNELARAAGDALSLANAEAKLASLQNSNKKFI